jgi:hypothetical protein
MYRLAAIAVLAIVIGSGSAGARPNPDDALVRPTPNASGIVRIVDVEELPPPLQARIDAIIERTSPRELQALRGSLDANPPVSAVLKAKGVHSVDVMAANIDADGGLILFTNTAA